MCRSLASCCLIDRLICLRCSCCCALPQIRLFTAFFPVHQLSPLASAALRVQQGSVPPDTDSWAFAAACVEPGSAAVDPSLVKRPYPALSTGLVFIQVCCYRCVPATETCWQPLALACCLLLAAPQAKSRLLAVPSYFLPHCTFTKERLANAQAAWI